VVCLGEVELGSGADFGGDLALAGGRKPLLEHVARRLGFALLRFAVGQDRGAVLRALVAALAHALRRVMLFPEQP